MKALLGLTLAAGLAVPVAAQSVSNGAGAMLRGLDKLTGDIVDFELMRGGISEIGRLRIELGECRYPAGNPSGDAFAFLTIREEGASEAVFSGWMIASSPALNALDHPRYDVWVLRCKTE